ncbi:MAG: hypothetical protein JXR88_05060 [Clostridia bacterium]|nr:hypothetical protein [Clostridia bacterium]
MQLIIGLLLFFLNLPLFWIFFRKLYPSKIAIQETLNTILKAPLRPYKIEEAKEDLRLEFRLFIFLMLSIGLWFFEFIMVMVIIGK